MTEVSVNSDNQEDKFRVQRAFEATVTQTMQGIPKKELLALHLAISTMNPSTFKQWCYGKSWGHLLDSLFETAEQGGSFHEATKAAIVKYILENTGSR